MDERSNDLPAVERLEALGRAIKRFRRERTQAELGKLLGIPQTTVSRWEAGTVDLGLEQIRAIEKALSVPFGTLGRASGFVDPCLTGDEDVWPGFRTGYFNTFEDAQAEVAAADVLGLGVRLFNRWEPEGDGTRTMEWVVVLYEDAYEVNP